MPTHILVECPEYLVSASLGVVSCLKPIERTGQCKVRFVKTMEIRAKDIVWADIIVTVRGCEPQTVRIVEEAKKAGRFILYYLDDDLLHIPEESLARAYYEDPKLVEGMKHLLSQTDVLWGVNPNIQKKYLSMTSGRWIQNRVPKEPTAPITNISEENPIKILYAGSSDHEVIVREILSPVIRRLCNEYEEKIDVTFIGVDPHLQGIPNVHYFPFIKPYESYQAYVSSGNFSIGLAPGRMTPFFACKYYNKFLEYTAIGAAGVYTDYEPFTQIVINQENGILCDNTEEAWYQAIKTLLDNPALLLSCAHSARSTLCSQFNTEVVTEDLLSQCPELTEYTAPFCTDKSVYIPNGYYMFYLERTKLLWRQKGVCGLPLIAVRILKVCLRMVWRRSKRFVQNLFRWDN